MLCQNETGVLSGSVLFFNTADSTTQRLFYYVNACGHYYCEAGYRIRRNFMDSLLLMAIEKGSMHVEYEGAAYEAGPGDVVLMDCTYPQFYRASNYVEFYWMHVGGLNAFELCQYLTRETGLIVHHTADDPAILSSVRYIVSQFVNNQSISSPEHSRLLHGILCRLMPGAAVAENADVSDMTPVQQAILFISDNLSRDLSLPRIAEQVHISPSHLIRLFRAEVHRSPHEYIILARIDRAKYLLKTTDLPVKVIAGEVGYRTESSFTSAFTDRIGLSPRRFRELPLG